MIIWAFLSSINIYSLDLDVDISESDTVEMLAWKDNYRYISPIYTNKF